EGLVSRCVQGLVVQVQAPDQPTRLALVNRLAQRRGLVLQPGLDERVAALAGRSVRELEGTLAHLHALASLAQPAGPTRMVNRGLVEKLVAGQAQLRARRPVRFDDIRDTVCGHFNVPAAQVAGSSRHRLVVLARAMLIHLTRQMTTLSFPEIAAALGKPSHSTVVTASQRMSRQLEDNRPLLLPGFAEPLTPVQLVEDIRREVLQSLSAA
ncbi:MAG: helix-turn-helix domain-containing protein, partial [Planctomycetota bacterium]